VIYEGSILRCTRPPEDGGPVQVKDHRQRFLGTGLYNSRSKLRVRLLSREREAFDPAFFERRIREAWAFRQRHLPHATSLRVVNAESDQLSGLVVDKYTDVLVVQTSALGMDQRLPVIVEGLRALFSPRAVVERNDPPGVA
jgi:23S rRNA (cytosine1962-C5)-methyltransferase